MENGYDMISRIVDGYCWKYDMNKLVEDAKAAGLEVITVEPNLSPEQIAENRQRHQEVLDYLENLDRFHEESRKVVIMCG